MSKEEKMGSGEERDKGGKLISLFVFSSRVEIFRKGADVFEAATSDLCVCVFACAYVATFSDDFSLCGSFCIYVITRFLRGCILMQ